MKKRCYVPFIKHMAALAIAFGSVQAPAHAERPLGLLSAVRTEMAPVVDGNLSDAAWAKTPEAGGFTQIVPGHPASTHPTTVRCVYDAHNLYIGFRTQQPRASLKATTSAADGEVWNDDSIDIFIKAHVSTPLLLTRFPEEQHFHFIFNSLGTKFEELGTAGGSSWNGDWEVKTAVGDHDWQAEVRIPFTALTDANEPPPLFSSWMVQLGHTSAAGPEHSALFPTQGVFRKHEDFGHLVFIDQAQSDAVVQWNVDRQQSFTPALSRIDNTIATMTAAPGTPFAVQLKDLAGKSAALSTRFKSAAEGYNEAVRGRLFTDLRTLESQVRAQQESLVAQKARQMGAALILAPHPAIKDQRLVKPDFLPEVGDIGRTLEASVTPGEYQASSMVLWSDKPLKNVIVEVGNLSQAGVKKSLPSRAVDVRWVKCWYQGGDRDIVQSGNVLVPELLLKNPDLVTVDYKAEKNVLLPHKGAEGHSSVWAYPGDAVTLQPLRELAARTATQVWFTINVPRGTKPGLYRGQVNIFSGGRRISQLPIQIRVLDFELDRSMIEHNWYAETNWGAGDNFGQNTLRVKAEIKNLVEHGVDYVGMNEQHRDLKTVVALMREGGMKTDKLYFQTNFGDSNFGIDMPLDKAEKNIATWVAAARAAGVNDIYVYLQDEARDEALRSQRPMADIIHRAGAKIWVACAQDYFDKAGDFIDQPIVSGWLWPELADKVHAAGGKIYSYANPQGGVERPETYRRNYGLRLWQSGYDGAFNWGLYQAFGSNLLERNTWDEYLHSYYRQCCMVYPTKTGVVDTIQWEGWREGMNDCRYLATLLREVREAKTAGRNALAVQAAESWLAQLKAGGESALNDLDSVRAEMIQHIQACRAT